MQESWPGVAAWLSEMENAGWKKLITELLADPRPMPDAEGVLKGSSSREGMVKILRDDYIKLRITAISQRLGVVELPESSSRNSWQKGNIRAAQKIASDSQKRSMMTISDELQKAAETLGWVNIPGTFFFARTKPKQNVARKKPGWNRGNF